MKIAFLSANREQMPDPVVPLGLLHVMAATSDRHDKRLFDLCFSRAPLADLSRYLAEFSPDVVALGLRNLHNSDYSGTQHNVAYYVSLMEVIRRDAPKAKVVLGGGGFSVLPEELMQQLRPDFGILGEGEESFSQLLVEMEAPAPQWSRVSGLFFFANEQLESAPIEANFLDLNFAEDLPRALVDKRYYEKTGTENIQTKRGCALKCSYCSYPKIEGRKYRLKEPRSVVNELERSLTLHPEIRHFFIVDSVFNIPSQHAKDICREMIQRGFKTPWTCYLNPKGFDAELAELMNRAGCVGMEIGADSGCDEILLNLHKGFLTKDIRHAHELAAANDLKDCHTFLLGTPGESMAHVRRTMEFITELDPFAAIVMVWTDATDVLDTPEAAERRALREQIVLELGALRSQFPRLVIPALGENFNTNQFRYLRLLGHRGPLWQQIRGEVPQFFR